MESWYDEEEDILDIEINGGKYWKSVELDNGIVIDIDKKGVILSIEILKASKVFAKDKEVIEASKHLKEIAYIFIK